MPRGIQLAVVKARIVGSLIRCSRSTARRVTMLGTEVRAHSKGRLGVASLQGLVLDEDEDEDEAAARATDVSRRRQ